MNSIVSDVIALVNNSDNTAVSLVKAHDAIGRNPLRVVGINLVGWWRRELLQTSRHPYLSLNPNHDWRRNLEVVLTSTPELAAIVALDECRCGFATSLNADDIATINNYARANYKPTLRR